MNIKNPAFSLIQTIVSIVILSASLSATTMLVATVIGQTAQNKSRITGIYLAQECLELVRNNRDSAWKENLSWDCAFPNKSSVYSISKTNDAIDGSDCMKGLGIKIEETPSSFEIFKMGNGFGHEGGEKTQFQRMIFVSDVLREDELDNNSPAKKMTITCQVSWIGKGKTEKIEISEVLSNWRKK